MDWLTDSVNWLGEQINNILSWICVVLPDSPFKLLDYTPVKDILPFVNWFIPVQFMLDTFAAWCAVILVYYGYSIILRFIKAVN